MNDFLRRGAATLLAVCVSCPSLSSERTKLPAWYIMREDCVLPDETRSGWTWGTNAARTRECGDPAISARSRLEAAERHRLRERTVRTYVCTRRTFSPRWNYTPIRKAACLRARCISDKSRVTEACFINSRAPYKLTRFVAVTRGNQPPWSRFPRIGSDRGTGRRKTREKNARSGDFFFVRRAIRDMCNM